MVFDYTYFHLYIFITASSECDRKRGRLVVKIGNVIRVGNDYFLVLFILYVPVDIVCITVKPERQLIVDIAFGIVVFVNIPAEHETIDNLTFTGTVAQTRVVVALDLYICPELDPILQDISSVPGQSAGIESAIFVGVLPFVFNPGFGAFVSLQVFIEIEGRCVFRMKIGYLRRLGQGLAVRHKAIYGFATRNVRP